LHVIFNSLDFSVVIYLLFLEKTAGELRYIVSFCFYGCDSISKCTNEAKLVKYLSSIILGLEIIKGVQGNKH
jgi:hypothetical protein